MFASTPYLMTRFVTSLSCCFWIFFGYIRGVKDECNNRQAGISTKPRPNSRGNKSSATPDRAGRCCRTAAVSATSSLTFTVWTKVLRAKRAAANGPARGSDAGQCPSTAESRKAPWYNPATIQQRLTKHASLTAKAKLGPTCMRWTTQKSMLITKLTSKNTSYKSKSTSSTCQGGRFRWREYSDCNDDNQDCQKEGDDCLSSSERSPPPPSSRGGLVIVVVVVVSSFSCLCKKESSVRFVVDKCWWLFSSRKGLLDRKRGVASIVVDAFCLFDVIVIVVVVVVVTRLVVLVIEKNPFTAGKREAGNTRHKRKQTRTSRRRCRLVLVVKGMVMLHGAKAKNQSNPMQKGNPTTARDETMTDWLICETNEKNVCTVLIVGSALLFCQSHNQQDVLPSSPGKCD